MTDSNLNDGMNIREIEEQFKKLAELYNAKKLNVEFGQLDLKFHFNNNKITHYKIGSEKSFKI